MRSDLGGPITILPASDPLLTDEHIDAVLDLLGTTDLTVAYLARELVVRFASKPVFVKAGDLTVDYRERIPQWQALAGRSSGTSAVGYRTVAVVTEAVW